MYDISVGEFVNLFGLYKTFDNNSEIFYLTQEMLITKVWMTYLDVNSQISLD